MKNYLLKKYHNVTLFFMYLNLPFLFSLRMVKLFLNDVIIFFAFCSFLLIQYFKNMTSHIFEFIFSLIVVSSYSYNKNILL